MWYSHVDTFENCCASAIAIPISVTHEPATLLENLKSILQPLISMPYIVSDNMLVRSTNDMKTIDNLMTLFK